jgi:hypothetical protein
MERLWTGVRAIALLLAGSVMVHELRYVFAYGGNAGAALSEQGHSYLPTVEALAVVLLATALMRFAVALAGAARGERPTRRATTFARLWLGASAALVAMYTLQEGFEGTFEPGHPSGVVGVYGHGGWSAVFLSLAVGAVIATITRIARWSIDFVATRATEPRRRWAPAPISWIVPPPPPARRLDVLVWNLAGRAPPA